MESRKAEVGAIWNSRNMRLTNATPERFSADFQWMDADHSFTRAVQGAACCSGFHPCGNDPQHVRMVVNLEMSQRQ